ncbi:hypothetical protein B7P43_G12388 [Cryptotermes secundus]|uniref:Tudor domain-containing protein 1 n=1 Tax=Cryptotermes secundus TaxID=105785 RepID=A0A2J7RBL7_9NEOP|nr:tudor domain-containing protein 1 isoform X2 [Cryptotermes secundus]PNF38229.1 hypothetical protein B7P43_G12388 [Cryptotermes secundus]PNF38230.1 hypothetical protein B7P43_G12388 [Cryptotermes secundus]
MAKRSLLQHEAPDWDPMSTDYYDPNFNNYAHGPGSRLDRQLQPCYTRLERENSVFKLHVMNIPAQLSENGIINVFLNFGDPLDVYRHPPGYGPGWAFVSYATQREAELAIRELNNAPPFYFRVQFARSAAEKERIRKEREDDELLRRVLDSEPYPVQSERIPFVPFNRGLGRGRGIPLPRQMGAGCRPGKFEQLVLHSDDSLNGEDADENMSYFSPHVPGMYDETNRMIMQKGGNLVANSPNGRRWVSMGRGYFPASERPSVETRYEIEIKTYTKDERHLLAESIERMYEREYNGWYEYGQMVDMTGKYGKCSHCERKTTQYCQRCCEWYCSRECQVKDWPRHKTNCVPRSSVSDFPKLPGSQENYGSAKFSERKQRQERNDTHQDSEQSGHNISGGVGCSDSQTQTHFCREEQSRTSSKKSHSKHHHDGQNVNEHRNSPFTSNNKDRLRSSNSCIEAQTVAGEGKKKSVNERLRIGPQMEKSGISPKMHQDSGVVASSVDTGPVQKTIEPLAESRSKISVVSKDTVPARAGDAVAVKTPGAEVSRAVSKTEASDLRDSTVIGSSKCEELSKDRFTKVRVTVSVGPTEYWVQTVDSEAKFVDIMKVLYEAHEMFPCDLQVGAMCAASYEGLWYRGKVTSVKPELKVFYIDFGNEEVCTPDEVKALPPPIMDIPPLGLRIKLAEGTSEKYRMLKVDDMIFIKPVEETSDGAILVHVEGELYKPVAAPLLQISTPPVDSVQLKDAQEKGPLPQPKQDIEIVHVKGHKPSFAVDGLKVKTQGGGQFIQHLIGGDFTATIVYPEIKEKFVKLFGELQKACESAPVDKNYKPNVGDMVGAFAKVGVTEEDNTWNRAYILSFGSSGHYQVSFCDVGCIGNVKTVKKLPEDLASIPEFAARCSVISCTKPTEKLWSPETRRFLFTVESVNEVQKTVTCVLQSVTGEEICKAVLRRWVPSIEDEGLKSVEIKNNDIVVLQVFFNQKSLFIRPASSSAKEVYSQLIQDVGLHCIKAPELDHLPSKNEMVACQFAPDGNYYRAQVLEVKDEVVEVTYVDFGNMVSVTKDKLKPLPDDLKRIPCQAVKVTLKDVVAKPLTPETNDFLSKLIGGEVEMKLIMAESHKDGVQLILPDSSCLNDVINTMLKPDKSLTEWKIFMEGDIKYLELPIGKTIDFLVLHKMNSVTLMGCEANEEIMVYVHTTMTKEINSYCNSTKEKSYVPRYSELCFARYEDGVWYRAMCLEEHSSKENNIIFLDFGNMAYIDKTRIRKMVPEFVETPAVALLCSMKGIDKNSSETLKKRVDELIQVNKIYKAHVVSCLEPGNYVIEFPHITEVLIKENLLPSEK